MSRRGLAGLHASIFLLTFLAPSIRADDKRELAGKVSQILKTNCHRCHGENGTNEGGFSYLLDRDRLVARRKVVPNDARKSKVYNRLVSTDDPMPPADEKKRPSQDDIILVKQWIESGAPPFMTSTAGERPFLTPDAVLGFMKSDLEKANERDRRFFRYFTITQLYNSGASDDELQSHRVGLSKLVNSLSWGRKVVVPRPVDPAKTILRIDLRDYKWNEKVWDDILFANPYGVHYGTDAEQFCREVTGTRLPHVRADWFVFAASRPPLYHDVLQLPTTDRELENRLQVNVAENIRQERVARAGFNGSGVSRNNRLIERHETGFGAYWKSYDFGGNAQRKNLFAHPLGPDDSNSSFLHDGGELIYNLPNGLQAYLLVDGKGNRIDKGPAEIVSDPRQGDRHVVNGISCMSCHARGMIDKADQVREQVKKNPESFTQVELDTVLALFPPKEQFAKLLREDAEIFKQAVEKTGAPLTATEPVAALAQRFELELDLKQAAAEVGLPPGEFLNRLQKDAQLGRVFGALRVESGTIQREVFVEEFSSLIKRLQVGSFVDQFRPQVAGPDPAPAPIAKRPFNPGTLTVTVPQVGSEDKKHVFRIEFFNDRERNNWIHLSEAGCLAVTPKTKELNTEGKVVALYSTELRARKPGENDFTDTTVTRTVAVKHDEMTDALIYITDSGSFAMVKRKKPEGGLKDFTHIVGYSFLARKAGESEISSKTANFAFEIYRDENTGLLLHLAADGTIAVTSEAHQPGDFKYSPYLHSFVCKVRKGLNADFTDDTRAVGVELWKDRSMGAVFYGSDKGFMAIASGKVTASATLAPTWLARFKLGVRNEGEGKLPNDERMGSIEIYRDENTGNLLYVSETGHFAVFPGK